MREKVGQKFFFTGNVFYFQKLLCSTFSHVLKKSSYNFHLKCQNTFWTLIYCPLRFFLLDFARKIWPKSFIQWKDCLFFRSFFFSHLLGPKEMILLLPQCFSEYLLDPLRLSPEVFQTRYCEKSKPKSFIPWKVCFLFKKVFVFSNLLGPRKRIL